MKKHNHKGLFVALEGLDGSGSSTQVSLLVSKLNSSGLKAFPSKEPTNNIIGGIIRGVLTKDWTLPADGLQLLYAADRCHNLKRCIIPEISKGNIIVSDRYAFSSIAFGSMDCQLEWLEGIYKHYPLPDITFFISVSPEVCIDRIRKSRSDFELFEEKSKLQKIFKTYKKLARRKENNIVEINGERPMTKIASEIYQIVRDRFLIAHRGKA